jgi:uncharacterized membrane protein
MLHDEMTISRLRPVRTIAALVFALMLAAMPFAGVTVARADGGLSISTQYPGITVSPGEDVTFALSVENETASPQNVALSVDPDTLPAGWEAYFEGGGNPVSRVYVDDADSDNNIVTVNLVLDIPEDVASGPNTIIVKAQGENGAADTLRLDVNIEEEEYKQGKLVSQYQEQQGSSTTIFSYTMTLTNSSSKAQAYTLSAGAPDGWQVSFYSSDGLQIASVNLEGNRGQTITMKADPPTDVAAGTYTIPVSAVSAVSGNVPLSVTFTAVVTGTYGMTLTTPSGLVSVDAIAGKSSTVTLTVKNTGTADLKDISLVTANVPADWAVRYETPKIDTLAAGQSMDVVAYIDAAADAINGDYVVSIKAKTSEVTSQVDFRVAVQTSTVWGIVGIAIVVVVVVALIFVFRKFGRR